MTINHINIRVTHGNRFVSQDDISRAEIAALEVFERRGVDAITAQAEYHRQWDGADNQDGMTGLALDWIAAAAAADRALTLTWYKPGLDSAACDIMARRA